MKSLAEMLRDHIPRYLDFADEAVAFRFMDLEELAELIRAHIEEHGWE